MTNLEQRLLEVGHSITTFGEALFPDLPSRTAMSRARHIVKHRRSRTFIKKDPELLDTICQELEMTIEEFKQIY
jgi:hypothetical protein